MLKKERKVASNLNITDQIVIYLDNLFSFDVVGHISVLIKSSVEVSSAPFVHRPPRNKDVVDLGALQENLKETDIALDDGGNPGWDLANLLQKILIPRELHLEVKLLVLQCPGDVIIRGKVKTSFQ